VNRIDAGRVLGQATVGGRTKTYLDWKRSLLGMGRREAGMLVLPWNFAMRAKRRVRGLWAHGGCPWSA